MKIPTKVVALVVAGIAAITAAVVAAAPQPSKRGPSVLTFKSNGKPVAVLTLNVLDDADAPLVITAQKGMQVGGDPGRDGKMTLLGGATVRLRQADEPAAFEIKADEMEVQWSGSQPAAFAAAPQASKREPSRLTLKSKGKPVAALTLELLEDVPLLVISEGSSIFVGPSEERGGKGTFSGGVTVRSGQVDEPAPFEIKAEEIEMQMDKPKLR